MVAEAQKRIGTKKVNKRVVLITDDASCALWTTDEDAARAKDDFKGMVERLVSQVSFGLCVVIVETDAEKSPEALEGAKLLKKAVVLHQKRARVGLLRQGSSDRYRPTDAGGVRAIGGVQGSYTKTDGTQVSARTDVLRHYTIISRRVETTSIETTNAEKREIP